MSAKIFVCMILSVIDLGACGTSGDELTHEMFYITHQSSAPKGTLAVDDDGSYRFTGENAQSMRNGVLPLLDFEKLKGYISDSGSQTLAPYRSPDSDLCSRESSGYLLGTNKEHGCFVHSNVSSSAAKEQLDFFVDLLNRYSR